MKLQSKQKLTRSYNNSPLRRQNPLSKMVQSYYVGHDVFQRDEQYYEQPLTSTRKRINKSIGQETEKQIKAEVQSKSQINQLIEIENHEQDKDHQRVTSNNKQLQQLREEHRKLRQEMQQISQELNNGGYGSYTVTKKSHYLSNPENQKIKQQQAMIAQLKTKIVNNNAKIDKYRKGIIFMQQKLRRVKKIDEQIFGQIKTIGAMDKHLEQRTKADLLAIVRQRYGAYQPSTSFYGINGLNLNGYGNPYQNDITPNYQMKMTQN